MSWEFLDFGSFSFRKFPWGQIKLILAVAIVAIFASRFVDCGPKEPRAYEGFGQSQSQSQNRPIRKPKTSQNRRNSEEDSDSDEDDEPKSRPEIAGMKGMASAGMSYLKAPKASPKCLGQDMRMEKLIQVTYFCEKETGEGKNETETMARSLCFTACMFKYLGLIGDDLMFTSSIDSVVVDIFPPAAHFLVKKAVRSCAKTTVLPLSKADNCTSFGPVKGCILRNVQNICNGDY